MGNPQRLFPLNPYKPSFLNFEFITGQASLRDGGKKTFFPSHSFNACVCAFKAINFYKLSLCNDWALYTKITVFKQTSSVIFYNRSTQLHHWDSPAKYQPKGESTVILIPMFFIGILITIINFYFLRSIIISGIKEAFKQMEEANAPTGLKPVRTDNTLITKSGLVFERKT